MNGISDSVRLWAENYFVNQFTSATMKQKVCRGRDPGLKTMKSSLISSSYLIILSTVMLTSLHSTLQLTHILLCLWQEKLGHNVHLFLVYFSEQIIYWALISLCLISFCEKAILNQKFRFVLTNCAINLWVFSF